MEVGMDFVERVFGLAPDGGNGSLELLYAVSIASATTLILFLLWQGNTSRAIHSRIRKQG
jgi:hypothetical protein